MYALYPLVELSVLVFGRRASRKQVAGLQRALEKRSEYCFCDQESALMRAGGQTSSVIQRTQTHLKFAYAVLAAEIDTTLRVVSAPK